MGFYASMDTDLQDLEEAQMEAHEFASVNAGNWNNGSEREKLRRARLGENLAVKGWLTPTEADVTRRKIKTVLEAMTDGDTATAGYYLTSVATLLGVDVDADVEV